MKDTTSIFFPVTDSNGHADERRFNAADFAEQSEHITLEGAEDETRYAYSRTGDAALEVFTGV